MSKIFKFSLASAVCLAAACIAWPQAAPDPLDSLVVCASTQHLIFENQFVRVLDDSIPAGVSERRHRHRHSVVVYLADYTVQQTTDDGKIIATPRKAGTAAWSDAVIHTVKNVGATPSHAIRVELKF